MPTPEEEQRAQAIIDLMVAVDHRLKVKARQGRTGWRNSDWEDVCIDNMRIASEEGDILDMVGYAVFAHYHGWPSNGR